MVSNDDEDVCSPVTEWPAGNSCEGTGEFVWELQRWRSGSDCAQVCDSVQKGVQTCWIYLPIIYFEKRELPPFFNILLKVPYYTRF